MATHDLVSLDPVPHSQRERQETLGEKKCEGLVWEGVVEALQTCSKCICYTWFRDSVHKPWRICWLSNHSEGSDF